MDQPVLAVCIRWTRVRRERRRRRRRIGGRLCALVPALRPRPRRFKVRHHRPVRSPLRAPAAPAVGKQRTPLLGRAADAALVCEPVRAGRGAAAAAAAARGGRGRHATARRWRLHRRVLEHVHLLRHRSAVGTVAAGASAAGPRVATALAPHGAHAARAGGAVLLRVQLLQPPLPHLRPLWPARRAGVRRDGARGDRRL